MDVRDSAIERGNQFEQMTDRRRTFHGLSRVRALVRLEAALAAGLKKAVSDKYTLRPRRATGVFPCEHPA